MANLLSLTHSCLRLRKQSVSKVGLKRTFLGPRISSVWACSRCWFFNQSVLVLQFKIGFSSSCRFLLLHAYSTYEDDWKSKGAMKFIVSERISKSETDPGHAIKPNYSLGWTGWNYGSVGGGGGGQRFQRREFIMTKENGKLHMF